MTRPYHGPLAVLLLVISGGLRPPLAGADEPKTAELKLSKEEQKVLDLTNEARAKEKLPPLKPNATLMKVAQAHSENMARQGKMEHVLDGRSPTDRVEKAGYDYKSVGENIGLAEKGVSAKAEAVFKGWMESKIHRENILASKFEEIGLGIAKDEKGEVYYTQVFGTQRKKR